MSSVSDTLLPLLTVPVLPVPRDIERFGATIRLTFPGPGGQDDVLTVTVGALRSTLVYAKCTGGRYSVSGRSWPSGGEPSALAGEFAAQVAAFLAL